MKQFKRSFWQLLFFLTLALSLITLAFIKKPKFQSSLDIQTARVWGYDTPIPTVDLNAFKNDAVVKEVFGILNKLFSDKKSAVSLFIHQFLLNKANLAKSSFQKHFSYTAKQNIPSIKYFQISNRARTFGLWTTAGERAFMNPDFKLSSLVEAQKDQNWLNSLISLVGVTAVFDSDYSKDPKVQGPFNLQKTRTNIYNLFMGWVVEEMKVQLKDDEGLFAKSLVVLLEEMKVQLKVDQGLQGPQGNKGEQGGQGLQGPQGNKGDQGFGTQGEQGLRGPTGQSGQIEKEAVIGLSIGLGVVFCLFLACVIMIYQKRIFSIFKNPQKSTKI